MTDYTARAHVATVGDLRMCYVRAGDGPLVLLLHGWPQTSYCWRHLIEPLARRFTVVVPDLRGYGATDKPTAGFDKRTMAEDVRGLARGLGFERVTLVGHDRGGRVAHRYALDHPDEVERVVVMDILPTHAMWARMDHTLAGAYWHWLFHQQPDLPERLAGADVAGYLGYFFERWTHQRQGLDRIAVEEYVRAFSAPGALRCGFDDYRAAPVDQEHDEVDRRAGRRIAAPLLVLWGDAGLHSRLPTVEIWRDYADVVHGEEVADCGHFLAEEQPASTLAALERFLGQPQ